MNPESVPNAGEKLLGTRQYCASEKGGQAEIIKERDGKREKMSVGFKQGETIQGMEITQEGLRMRLSSPPMPLPSNSMAGLRLGLVFPDGKYSNTDESGYIYPNKGEKTYLIDPTSIKGEWKPDRRPAHDNITPQRSLSKRRINALLNDSWVKFRGVDWPTTIRNLTLQAANQALQERGDEPISKGKKTQGRKEGSPLKGSYQI